MDTSPNINTLVRLDNFVEVVCPSVGQTAYFFESEDFTLRFTQARVSPIYKSNRFGMHGLLKVAQWRGNIESEKEIENVALIAVVLAPENAVQMLEDINPTAAECFLHDFIHPGSRRNKESREKRSVGQKPEGEIYQGYQFPEAAYHIGHFKFIEPFSVTEENRAQSRADFCKLLVALTRRVSRMDQWVHHCIIDKKYPKGRPPSIPYEGLGTRPLALGPG